MAARKAKSKARRTTKRSAKPRKRPAKRALARRKTARPRAGGPKSRAAAAAPANAIGFLEQHMSYTTHNFEGVKRFYTELLGFSGFRLVPEGPYLAIQTGPSSSVGFMPPQPGPPEQWQPPREPALHLMVEDVDRAHRELVAKGVLFESEPSDTTWGRVAMLRDPEGRSVRLSQMKRRG